MMNFDNVVASLILILRFFNYMTGIEFEHFTTEITLDRKLDNIYDI